MRFWRVILRSKVFVSRTLLYRQRDWLERMGRGECEDRRKWQMGGGGENKGNKITQFSTQQHSGQKRGSSSNRLELVGAERWSGSSKTS